MNIFGRFAGLGACVAAFILTGCSGNNADPQPVESTQTATPANPVTLSPAEPESMDHPNGTTRDDKGDLVCEGGPVVLIEALNHTPTRDIELSNGRRIHIAVTPKGLLITGDLHSLSELMASVIMNNSVGTDIQPMPDTQGVFSDGILLTKEAYGEARTFALCKKRPIKP